MTHPQRQKSPPRADVPELSPADARLVSRIEESYRAPERLPDARVAFQEALDARLARSRGGLVALGRARAFAGVAAVGALGVLAWTIFAGLGAGDALESGRIAEERSSAPVVVAMAELASREPADFEATPEEALLALSADGTEVLYELPDDYEAIASLFLGDAV